MTSGAQRRRKKKAKSAVAKEKGKVAEKALTRKDHRKLLRRLKKQRKNDFFHTKKPSTKNCERGNGDAQDEEDSQEVPRRPVATAEREKRKLEVLQKEQEKQRRKRLREDNEVEEQNLRRLEKKLGLDKKKEKKVFEEDGLDFLLDACDGLAEGGGEEDSGDSDDSGSDQEPDACSEEEKVEEEVNEEEGLLEEDEQAGLTDDEGNDEVIQEDSSEEEEAEPVAGGQKADCDDDGEWEDIYGRRRDAHGSVLPNSSTAGKYIPPAMRRPLDGDKDRTALLSRISRKAKGLLNRLATANVGQVARQLEDLYLSHSRNDVNASLFRLLAEAIMLSSAPTPERMVLEHALLVAILHVNVGAEVGATLLQSAVQLFEEKSKEVNNESKEAANCLLFIVHLFTFKVIEARLVFDLMEQMANKFSASDVELLLVSLRAVGFGLRKSDPDRLKALILHIQRKSTERSQMGELDSRVRFMLDVLMAVKNNNLKKIPKYDPEHQQLLLKNMQQWLRPGSVVSALNVSLQDLLQADQRGRWWIVGSAWTGGTPVNKKAADQAKCVDSSAFSYSSELLEKARQMRMNTDVRKNLFCAIMSAEDYLDAFEKVVKFPLKTHKEREVAFVLLDCCLQERRFNPYYAQLALKLALFERKYKLAMQFAIWDRIKELTSLQSFQLGHLASYTAFLVKEEALSLTCLKVVEFAELDKVRVTFLKKVLAELLDASEESKAKIFGVVAAATKLRTFRESLRLFMHHFMLKDKKLDNVGKRNLKKKVEAAEAALMSSDVTTVL